MSPSPHLTQTSSSSSPTESTLVTQAAENTKQDGLHQRNSNPAESATAGNKEVVTPSLGSLKRTIPSRLFERSLARSVGYLVRDVVALCVLAGLYAKFLNEPSSWLAHPAVWYPAYACYAFAQGTFMWALFVVGHDCGHRSFCSSKTLCDVFGTLSHTPLLVPFHAWRLSHRQHHRRHNHVEEDESFVPVTRSHYASRTAMPPLSHFVRFTFFPVLGFTIYLLFGMPPSFHSHFSPSAFSSDKKKQESDDPSIEPTDDAIADDHAVTTRPYVWANDSERRQVRESILFVVALVALVLGFAPVSWGALLLGYGMPYAVFVAYLAIVTHLHHTHPEVNYYRGSAWSFVRGGLSTVNRSFSAPIDHITHDIGEHTVHHLFPALPHYSLVEANVHLRPALGDNYRYDDTPMLKALIRNWFTCRAVEDKGEVLQYLGIKEVGRPFF